MNKNLEWIRNDFRWLWLGVAIAWLLLINTGHSHAHAHSHLMPMTLLHEWGSWEIMIIAMMLPSTLPMLTAFLPLAQSQAEAGRAQLAFLLAYLVLWSMFSTAIVVGAIALRPTLNLFTPWLTALTLIGVGLFQFSPMKQRCLSGCRSATLLIAQQYQPGWKGGWNLGIQHGLFCLGCCWALMTLMLISGMSNLLIMLGLTAIMTLERLWQHGKALSLTVGAVLIAGGLALLMINALEIAAPPVLPLPFR